VIEFKNVTKKYTLEDDPALKNLDLFINPGEFVYLVGPSGSGKSTLLNLVLRLEKSTEGEVIVNGQNLSLIADRHVPKFRRNLGVVFQSYKLLPQKTVFENVIYPLQIFGLSQTTSRKKVQKALETVSLTGKENRYPKELSGGEQQRVAIARAIVNEPDIILADEPTGNLDPKITKEIINLFEKINADGTLILMSTHDPEIVNKYPSRVIELSLGHKKRDEELGSYHLASEKVNLNSTEKVDLTQKEPTVKTVVKDEDSGEPSD